jgi:NitT/TauT family transport system substrate-binding protein
MEVGLTSRSSRVGREEIVMNVEWTDGWSRRDFVRGLTLAGTAGVIGLRPGLAYADPPPETTKLRLFQAPPIA